jgi:hypothetical protein
MQGEDEAAHAQPGLMVHHTRNTALKQVLHRVGGQSSYTLTCIGR